MKKIEFYQGELWWALTGSNRRHSACKADALPTELSALRNKNSIAIFMKQGSSP